MPGKRMDSMIRQWKLLRMVAASHYMTAPILADKLECCVKTIYRDVLVLEAAGFPLNIGGCPEHNHIRLAPDWFLGAEPKRAVPMRELERKRA